MFWCSFSLIGGVATCKYCFLSLASTHQVFGILSFRISKFLHIFLIYEVLVWLLFFDKTHKLHWLLRRAGKMFLLRVRKAHHQKRHEIVFFAPWIFSERQVNVAVLYSLKNYILLAEKLEHSWLFYGFLLNYCVNLDERSLVFWSCFFSSTFSNWLLKLACS